jgi:hypothetical protein
MMPMSRIAASRAFGLSLTSPDAHIEDNLLDLRNLHT